MMMQFPRLPQMRRTGREPFHAEGSALPFDLLSFWQWYASDLAGNALRGCIAEYLVLQALGAKPDVRQEWDAVDIRLPSGATVKVKVGGLSPELGPKEGVPHRLLDDKAGSQKKINLPSLLRLIPEAVDYTGLKAAVARAAAL